MSTSFESFMMQSSTPTRNKSPPQGIIWKPKNNAPPTDEPLNETSLNNLIWKDHSNTPTPKSLPPTLNSPVITESQFLKSSESETTETITNSFSLKSAPNPPLLASDLQISFPQPKSTPPPIAPLTSSISPKPTSLRVTRNGTIAEQQSSIIQALTEALHNERTKRAEVEKELQRLNEDSIVSSDRNAELRGAL
jgi:hypothetical protein